MNKNQKKILITGVSGFIGKALCVKLSKKYNVFGIDRNAIDVTSNIIVNFSDITDYDNIFKFINFHKPDFIIHCAGIAHQKIGRIDSNEYFRVNSYATQKLAQIATTANPDVHFIFLSSISVYGEENIDGFVSEKYECNPSSDYADSKLDAERRLIKQYNAGELKKLDILRLAPVYSSKWSLNLDRRVFAPEKLVYLQFGSGEQKMSAISRSNLVEFIEFIVNKRHDFGNRDYNIYNVCDEQPYSFKEIIKIFKQSKYQPDRVVVTIPLSFVWILTRITGLFLKNKKKWLHSCYDKLAKDLIFDNTKMLVTGFKPVHTLETIFKK